MILTEAERRRKDAGDRKILTLAVLG